MKNNQTRPSNISFFAARLQKKILNNGEQVKRPRVPSREDGTGVGGNKIFDIDVCVLSSMNLELLEGMVDEFSQVGISALRVVNLVTEVGRVVDENIENG
jgi:hypothetical protein